jgi:hypothetical protein
VKQILRLNSALILQFPIVAFLIVGFVLFGSRALGQPAPAAPVEEIRILRSIRLSRAAPTEFCSQPRTGFSGTQNEDKYSLTVVTSRTDDGLVTDSTSKKVGAGHVCLGPGADAATMNLYLEVELAGLAFRGSGKCTRVTSEFPESGLSALNCVASLSGLPEPYVGGLMTSNTMLSRKTLGAESEPPGYAQASILTVRLWKRREARSR